MPHLPAAAVRARLRHARRLVACLAVLAACIVQPGASDRTPPGFALFRVTLTRAARAEEVPAPEQATSPNMFVPLDTRPRNLVGDGRNSVEFGFPIDWTEVTRHSDGTVLVQEVHASGQRTLLRGFATLRFLGGGRVATADLPVSTTQADAQAGAQPDAGTAAAPAPAQAPAAQAPAAQAPAAQAPATEIPGVSFPAVAERTGLSAVITFTDGRTSRFEADAGQELGDYVAGFAHFRMRNIRVTPAGGLPLTLYFRPDRGSDRVEVVVENFRLSGTPANLGAYTMQVLRDGRPIGEARAAEHFWLARWRWQSAPRPPVRSAADLKSLRLIPGYRPEPGNPRPRAAAVGYAPMEFAGLTPYMPTTGDREDIGPQTEAVGEYLVSGSATSRQAMLNQAEAFGSWSSHFRDDASGAPISFDRYPKINFYYDQRSGTPAVPLATRPDHASFDVAHEPSGLFVPFLLTEDPYFLEEMQFAAITDIGATPYHEDARGVFGSGQVRGWAWGIRGLFQVAAATPEQPPPWLLPRGYWNGRLAANLVWFRTNVMDNPDPFIARFHSWSTGPWQNDMLATALGIGVWMGFDAWRPAFQWALVQAVQRTNGTSGYPRTRPVFYYWTVKTADGQAPASWSELAQLNGVRDTANGAVEGNTDYLAYLRGALAIGAAVGDRDAAAAFGWLAPKLTWLPYRWSFAP